MATDPNNHNVPAPALHHALRDFINVPSERILSANVNALLLADITLEEVLVAITLINRHKATGPDELNDDFLKDFQVLLAPALVNITNYCRDALPPASFLEGLIIPIRKRGYSQDAMAYRPIVLLQTGYKVVAKVISRRVQRVIGILIQDTQHGFLHERQISKTIMMMMMMAHLISATLRTRSGSRC